jgi:hypothetical protein
MSITRNHREIVFECDNCNELIETGEEEFHPAYQLAKDEGWKAQKSGSEWVHYCPDCTTRGDWD